LGLKIVVAYLLDLHQVILKLQS